MEVTKELLTALYWGGGLSVAGVALRLGCSEESARRLSFQPASPLLAFWARLCQTRNKSFFPFMMAKSGEAVYVGDNTTGTVTNLTTAQFTSKYGIAPFN
ncbi:hypothetical protein [Dickeya poaceiphila]|uniref:Uncharacterized protein n=1 Tax=Dickeya poaceiphila TaxID=568768 RepID=A0A5B8I4H8_9GAMM|nr:hypothetical protein [Dickeya poaceiphila]QDX29544.1 hypothetical protein Dpoa569_0001321 [Dickeya poaceiphila]